MSRKEIILLKYGEIALKGLNKNRFEQYLFDNIKERLSVLGRFTVKRAQSTIYVMPDAPMDLDDAALSMSRVFGISALYRAAVAQKDFEDIKACACEHLHEKLIKAKTFRVVAKRADKKFYPDSPEICSELGGYLLERYPNLTVDLHEPELIVRVEVRDFGAYVCSEQIKGAGGMPVGSAGRALLMISGGIDSPVAGYMLAKRGVELVAVHFESPPYTSERARMKVEDLVKRLSNYTGRIKLIVVPFTELQEKIRDRCPEDLFTVIMRRQMIRIADNIAREQGCGALITGESLGQVASQTMEAIAMTDRMTELPIFRPLIGMDKSEIVKIAENIGTFEISILPYEDCCTVFTPKHPKTKPRLPQIEAAEQALWDEESKVLALSNH